MDSLSQNLEDIIMYNFPKEQMSVGYLWLANGHAEMSFMSVS